MEQITLYFKQGGSDKVYQASIEPSADKFVVNFAFGRRGTTLQTGTKTQSPVNLERAKAIYDKLVQEKKSKGYTPGEDGTPYQHTDKEQRVTGFLPQLLNFIEEDQVTQFMNNPAYVMQEKFDGQRMLIRKEGAAIDGINRKGLMCGIPSILVKEVKLIPGDCVIDGECIGEVFWVFDILGIHGTDIRSQPYRNRLFALMQIISGDFGFIKLVDNAIDENEQIAMLEKLRRERREGVVFKHLDAPYTPGRPNSGGTQFKHKFYATASFIVGKANEKRSIALKLLNGKCFANAGNVTIPPNHQVPKVGAVVEVRYLYAFRESGVIYQPVYLGERNDIDPGNCLVTQLKYKADERVAA
jgi:bifunctional non-homologous end joining protein LigD